ncbi:hypothetical protein RBH29_00715 [Herbivorax sp. ANBcel31]|uniref:hypothetical protein n=1 Tax=Herbivorax sp. ANBcel31 TaxID=3069754 RepID=UPI0027B24EEC|nr:hypothetical protein [Herbivorax sp. ANBcel31]MDQ2084958.1 hypothetical protein [Herbivorax sp. ANBcel31]
MIYGVVPRRRRYPLKNPRNFAYNRTSSDSTAKKVEEIPLPNKVDTVNDKKDNDTGFSHKKTKTNKRLSLTDFISKRFKTDEIILLGLIFLLLEERINDDYLLIILTYLLITGMD